MPLRNRLPGKHPKKSERPGVDEYGRTEMHYAALKGDFAKIRSLTTEGKDINIQDDNGLTPLHFAVQEKQIETVKTLLELGSNPNILDRHGNGPLWTSILGAHGEPLIVAPLLAYGANPDQKNKYGKSPREMAEEIGHGVEKPFRNI